MQAFRKNRLLSLVLTVAMLVGLMPMTVLAAPPASVTVEGVAATNTFDVAIEEEGTNIVITLEPHAGLVFDSEATGVAVDGTDAAVVYEMDGSATITVASEGLEEIPDITGLALKTSTTGFKFYAAPFKSEETSASVLLTGVFTAAGTNRVIGDLEVVHNEGGAEPTATATNEQNGWFSAMLTGAPQAEYWIDGVEFTYNGIPVTASFASSLKVTAPYTKTAGVYTPQGAVAPNSTGEAYIPWIYQGTGGVQTAYDYGDGQAWQIGAQPGGAQFWFSTQQFQNTDLTKVTYTFLNTTSSTISDIKTEMDCDVKIRNSDSAPIYPIEGGFGFTMAESTAPGALTLALVNANTVRYNWWGTYSDGNYRADYLWDTTERTTLLTGVDSGAVAKAQEISVAPGELYQAVFYIGTGTAEDISAAVEGAIQESGNAAMESNYLANGTSLVINPTDTAYWYAVVDADTGAIIVGTDWTQGTGGAISFDDLEPSGKYQVIRIKSETKPGDSDYTGLDDIDDGDKSGEIQLPGTDTVTVPVADDVTREKDAVNTGKDTITIDNTDPDLEYNLYDPATGKLVSGTWVAGDDENVITFDNLDPDVEWVVVVRDPAGNGGQPTMPEIGPATGTLYPVITFDPNGGKLTSDATMKTASTGRLATLPTDPTRNRYDFLGWFDASTGGNAVDLSEAFSANTTVYAQWKYKGGSGGIDYSTPTGDTKTDVKDTSITTSGSQKVVENSDGSKTLPGGGTINVNDEVKFTAPNGTVVDASGKVSIPDGKTATLDLVESNSTATVPGGTTVSPKGTVTVGDGKATITLPNKNKLEVSEGSVIDGTTVTVGAGGASMTVDGKTYTYGEGQVLILDEDVPLGLYVQYDFPFSDVAEGDWYYEAVKFVFDNGIMNGTGADIFDPYVKLNRGMMVQILFNLDGKNITNGTFTFEDVAKGAWYEDAIAWAAPKGIVLGYSETVFAPLQNITREQMAAMLYRYCQYKGIELPVVRESGSFTDSASVSAYAKEAVQAMYQAGILNGKGNGVFDPQGTATRAEVAQMLMNFVEATQK